MSIAGARHWPQWSVEEYGPTHSETAGHETVVLKTIQNHTEIADPENAHNQSEAADLDAAQKLAGVAYPKNGNDRSEFSCLDSAQNSFDFCPNPLNLYLTRLRFVDTRLKLSSTRLNLAITRLNFPVPIGSCRSFVCPIKDSLVKES